MREQLASLAAAVGKRNRDSPGSALNAVVFGTHRFVREVESRDLRFALLPEVLRSRRGNCVGLGSLYLALAEQLGWKLEAVIVPGHFYVRMQEQGRLRNLELLRRGESMPDSWYAQRFPIPGGHASEYARALTAAEVVAVIEYDAGEELRRRGQLHEAQRAYDRARKHFPELAEAHASHGAVAQLLGDLDQALADYQRAQRVNPHLPGVDQNLALLRAERSGAGAALQ